MAASHWEPSTFHPLLCSIPITSQVPLLTFIHLLLPVTNKTVLGLGRLDRMLYHLVENTDMRKIPTMW